MSEDFPENSPELWSKDFPVPTAESHKYTRGTALIRGGAKMTGASRLAARAAQRAGAGLVTLASPRSALPIYASSLESVIVRPCDTLAEWEALANDIKAPVILMGPGLGLGKEQQSEVLSGLAAFRPTVLDADALTIFADDPETLFRNLHPNCILTPHEGEFAKLFGNAWGDKRERAMKAAKKAGCIILLKGAETIIAAPDGRGIVSRNGPPWLATGGSGDVLAGILLGLIAQKMPLLWAASAAAWLHGQAATAHGPGLIAEDIVEGLPAALHELLLLSSFKRA